MLFVCVAKCVEGYPPSLISWPMPPLINRFCPLMVGQCSMTTVLWKPSRGDLGSGVGPGGMLETGPSVQPAQAAVIELNIAMGLSQVLESSLTLAWVWHWSVNFCYSLSAG